MKSCRFPLESVKTLRRHRTVEAAAALAEASRLRMSRTAALTQSKAEVAELEREWGELLQHEVRAGDILRLRNGIDLGRVEIVAREQAARESAEKEEACRAVLLSRQAEEEAVARLEEKHRKAWTRELLRMDERASEDFVLARRSNPYVSF